MVQLLSHGAVGTWLLTDTDATARKTQGAAHLGDEFKNVSDIESRNII